MAKEKAIYAPGELNRVRQNLGDINADEAKRMAEVLGGEVGVEKNQEPAKTGAPPSRGRAQPMRRIEVAADETERGSGAGRWSRKKSSAPKKTDPDDDPNVPVELGYAERFKMDRYEAQSPFEIKSIVQLAASFLSFIKKSPDYVSANFITNKLGGYYKVLELLVISTRTLLPRNNLRNNEQLKKMSPFMFSILDVIRHWNIERISSDMARMQSRPKSVKVSDLTEILRAVYKPLFILEQLDYETHIKGAYKLLYKILYIDNPIDAKDKYQEHIRSALGAYDTVFRNIHFLLHPLLLKLLSNKWLPYQRFFLERRNRIMAFLNITEKDRISPESMNQKSEEEKPKEDAPAVKEPEKPEAETSQSVQNGERKAIDRGLRTLESLFPQGGWDKPETYPDMYGYFAKSLDLKKGYELIAPTDPLLQAVILIRVIEELTSALRYVTFEAADGIDGHLDEIINGWREYVISFTQEYLARLIEYCQLLETSLDSRGTNYAKRIYAELQGIKRSAFFPHYRFENIMATSVKKNIMPPVFPEIRKLRKYLTVVASGIEAGKQSGADKQGPCKGIANPWAPYNFQVASNPLAMRLDTLLGPAKRNNASLIYFTLSVVTVLDYFVNNPESWAYEANDTTLFRSIKGEGVIPQFGVDDKIDADMLFKHVMKARQKEKKEQKSQAQPQPPQGG
ncbi:MAG: hypothetical protein LBD13_05040 [Spirochaetaceae bacterium]|jgi:hypothetical protein|nr:hypothetical protein [Spirochaetaceae bacterium]